MPETPRVQDRITEIRRKLVASGFQPIALLTMRKYTYALDWQSFTGLPDYDKDLQNTGLNCRGLRVFDVDVDDAEAAAAIVAMIEAAFGKALVRGRPDSPRRALIYRCAGDPRPGHNILLSCGRLQILGDGQLIAAFGQHPDGAFYTWLGPDPTEVPFDDLRTVSVDQERALAADLTARWPGSGGIEWEEKKTTGPRPNGTAGQSRLGDDPADAEDALRFLPNTFDDHADWLRIGMSAFVAGASFNAFDAWSRQHPSYDAKRTASAWRSFERNGVRDITAATLFGLMRARVPTWEKPSRQRAKAGQEGQKKQQHTRGTTMTTIRSMIFDPLREIAPPYVVEGCTLLAGNPKAGKSWLCLQIGNAVSEGKPVFEGTASCEAGDVLMLALEDNPRRMQRRGLKMFGVGPWPSRMTIHFQSEPADRGGLDLIRAWAKSAENPRLAVVDVFALFRKPRTAKDDPYQADLMAVAMVRELAHELGIAIILVHHNRKSGAEIDPFEIVSGTMGLTAAADSVLILKRDSDGTMVLYGRGRDLEDLEVAMRFDRETARWEVLGALEDARQSTERKAILEALETSDAAMSPKDIAAGIRKPYGSIRTTLFRMMKDDPPSLRKLGRGLYTVAGKIVVVPPEPDYRAARDPG